MALLFSSPKGPAGAQIELDSPTGNILSPVVELFGGNNPAFGQQLAWAINPLTGSDAGPGTVAAPLATMAEFNRRYAGLFVSVSATLQLVGDVVDSPLWLRSTAFAAGASITVSGTVTPIATTATITVVASLSPLGGVPPWQLTTTGIVWTAVPLGSRVLLSNGTFGFIRNVIDANNVVVGALASTVFTGGISNVPAAAMTIVVQQLSRVLGANFAVLSTDGSLVASLRDVSLDTGEVTSSAPRQGNVAIFGCEIKVASGTTIVAVGGLQIRACRFTQPAGASALDCKCAPNNLNLFGCVFSGATTGVVALVGPGGMTLQHAVLQLARFQVSGLGFCTLNGSLNINAAANALTVTTGGFVVAQVPVTGSAGAGIGVDVPLGTLFWTGGLPGRPVVTGAGGDCRVAGIVYTYVALGIGKTASIDATLAPVTNTAANGPGLATLSGS